MCRPRVQGLGSRAVLGLQGQGTHICAETETPYFGSIPCLWARTGTGCVVKCLWTEKTLITMKRGDGAKLEGTGLRAASAAGGVALADP